MVGSLLFCKRVYVVFVYFYKMYLFIFLSIKERFKVFLFRGSWDVEERGFCLVGVFLGVNVNIEIMFWIFREGLVIF